MKIKQLYILVLLGVFLLAGRAGAVDTYWQVGTDDWSTGSNWNNGEPTASDVAYINNAGTAQVTENDEACDYLYLGDGSADSGTLDIISGSLSIGTNGYIGDDGTGTFTQSRGIHTVSRGLYLGYEASGSGTYELSDGLLAGDLNDDNFVGGDDLDIILTYWGQYVTPGDWLLGDPTGDGFVGGDENIPRKNLRGLGLPQIPILVAGKCFGDC